MTTQSADSSHKGSTGVAEYTLRRYLGLQLSAEQAQALAVELEAHLTAVELRSTVKEMRKSTTGKLDTLERGDVLDAVAKILTEGKFSWPYNSTPDAEFMAFTSALSAGAQSRQYPKFIE